MKNSLFAVKMVRIKTNNILLIVVAVIIFSCSTSNFPQLSFTPLELPTNGQSRLPHLYAAPDNFLYVSWIEVMGDSAKFLFSKSSDGENWTIPDIIASGKDWFVNWADYPMLFANKKGDLLAFFLQKNGDGTYAYDIKVKTKPIGKDWTPSFTPYAYQSQAEHGFVSVSPLESGNFTMVWLDGRHVNTEHSHESHESTEGAMSLRTVQITPEGLLQNEKELDNRVCDCCQTYAWSVDSTHFVVYRDRSEHEIRDIGFIKWDNKTSEKQFFPSDGWQISGCPVNGPRAAYSSTNQAIIWYTGANETPQIKFWEVGKRQPLLIDDTTPLGRTDLTSVGHNWWCTWLDMSTDTTQLKLAVVENSRKAQEWVLSNVDGSRKSGFPQMEYFNKSLFIVWTEVKKDGYSLKMIKSSEL